MSKVGRGYGSEFHLLRYLGYHRRELDGRVSTAVEGDSVSWLDWPFSTSHKSFHYGEWQGVGFLPDDSEHAQVRSAWRDFWPQTGTSPSWDAVGNVEVGGEKSWLLVEAKSHVAEIQAACKANPRALPVIRGALDVAKQSLAIAPGCDWTQPYYQFCNRLAILDFLTRHGINARLLFIYFVGDTFPEGRSVACPRSADEWAPALSNMYETTGWPGNGSLAPRVHRLFLPMHP